MEEPILKYLTERHRVMATVRLWAVTAIFCTALLGGLPSAAHATDVTNCYQVVQPGAWCPSGEGVLHTYYNERTSWSDKIDYSCGVELSQGMARAGSLTWKYWSSGNCYIIDRFPNNTERLWGQLLNLSRWPWTYVNKTAY